MTYATMGVTMVRMGRSEMDPLSAQQRLQTVGDYRRMDPAEAADLLVRGYYPYIFAVVLRLCRRWAPVPAEDLASIVVIDAIRRLSKGSVGDNKSIVRCLATWCKWNYVDETRKVLRRARVETDWETDSEALLERNGDWENEPAHRVIDALTFEECVEFAMGCINELDEPRKELIFRHYYCGETLHSIADDLGCAVQAVSQRLKRALAAVLKCMINRGWPAEVFPEL